VTLVPPTFDGQNWCVRWPNRASDHGVWQSMARYVNWMSNMIDNCAETMVQQKLRFVVCDCMFSGVQSESRASNTIFDFTCCRSTSNPSFAHHIILYGRRHMEALIILSSEYLDRFN
jgi:hypothetical protein